MVLIEILMPQTPLFGDRGEGKSNKTLNLIVHQFQYFLAWEILIWTPRIFPWAILILDLQELIFARNLIVGPPGIVLFFFSEKGPNWTPQELISF